MSGDPEMEEQSKGAISLDRIYFVLFRRKWIILGFIALAALGAGLLLFVVKPPQFYSEAKVFIRYVAESRTPTPQGVEVPVRVLNEADDSVINTEIDILRSVDVAQQVVRVLGAERILAAVGGGDDPGAAANLIQRNLVVEPVARRSVLPIFFRHPDPALAQEILREIINAYLKKHAEMHLPTAEFTEMFVKEAKRLQDELVQVEQQLAEARKRAGVGSLEDARKAYAEQISTIREELIKAQAELAAQKALLAQTGADGPAGRTNAPATNLMAQVPRERIAEYRRLCARLEQLTTNEQNLLMQFTDESLYVKAIRNQIAEVQAQKQKLESDYPALLSLGTEASVFAGPTSAALGGVAAAAQVVALESKIKVLEKNLAEVQAEVARADEMEATIVNLQRRKEMIEADLKRYSAAVEQARIEAALGSGKAPNISIIQSPTVPRKMWSKNFLKKLGMLTGGCVFCGFALAFLLEFVVDRSVKRPADVEKRLQLPLLMTIPDVRWNGHGKSRPPSRPSSGGGAAVAHEEIREAGNESGTGGATTALALWNPDDPLRRYCQGLRDQLMVDFEVKNIGHKPKLIAVTSCGHGAGVSSIARGLARALSETGAGNVLLVDANEEQTRAVAFHRGKAGNAPEMPISSLSGSPSNDSGNAGSAGAPTGVAAEHLPAVVGQNVAGLMPRLRASDYDYVIFDMPPVSQTSVTVRMAGLMDSVLLVLESEKTHLEAVERAHAMLSRTKANVSTVLNKVRSYIPRGLYQEVLADA
jgi:succinoglycan biosynthesis transport protein ExoP